METSFRTAAPLYRSYSRTRVGGDSAVSVTVAAAGSVMVVNFPVAPADLYFGASSLPGDAGPVTLSKVNDSTSEVGFYTDAVVVAWHEHAGYIDTDGDFSEAALAAQSLVTFSAYDLADMVDMTTYTVELTDPTGIIRRADLFAFNGPPAAAWRVGRIGWGTRGAWS